MNKLKHVATTTLTVVAASLALNAPLRAQVSEVSRTPIADAAQITFGYLCDDRFVVRNDGTKSIDLEYAVEKGNEHTKLNLNARESVELASKAKDPLELWMNGKLIAKAMKGKRSCKDVQGNSAVSVAPLEVSANGNSDQGYGRALPYPFYDPWGAYGYNYGLGYSYGAFGYGPYFGGIASYPIIIGGGIRGGGIRGGGRRR